MKKVFVIGLLLLSITTGAAAQNTVSGGFRRAGTNAQTKAMHTQQLQDSLGLSADQAKKADAIQQDFMLKMRAIKLDTQLADTARKARLQTLQSERKAKLKQVMTEQQLAKMDGHKPTIKKQKAVAGKKHKHTKRH